MRKFKKGFSILVIMILLATALVGCGNNKTAESSETASSDKIELKFLHKWPRPELNAYFEEVVAEFEKQNPDIKIKMEAAGDEAIKDKLRVMMGTATQPDIYFAWTGEFATKFVRSGNALDLTSAIENDSDWNNRLMKAGLEAYSYNDKVYGIPLRMNAKFFVYNKDLFDKYNLKAPKTWKEFENVMKTLKDNDVTPIGFGNIYPWAGCHYITGLNQKMLPEDVRKSDYTPKNGEFTHPGYIKAIEYFKSLADKGYFNDGFNSTEHNMGIEMFYSGQVAMTYVELIEFRDIDTDFQGDEWSFFPMPEIAEGEGNQNYITGAPDGFMISSNTDHPEEAIKFLKFLTSNEMAEKLVTDIGWPSAVIGAVNENNAKPFLVEGMKEIAKADGMALWLDTDINIKISDVYLPGLQEVLNGSKTPEELMKDVQEAAKKVREEMQ